MNLHALVAEAAAYPCRRAVITGGEPLESALFLPLCRALDKRDFTLEVETSGILPPPGDTPAGMQWNVSVKLAGSGVAASRRINPEAIRVFIEYQAWWKFVVVGEDDLVEVLGLVEAFALPRGRILLQSEGLGREDLVARAPWLIEACKRHGFRFSPRLHILVWGPRRGV